VFPSERWSNSNPYHQVIKPMSSVAIEVHLLISSFHLLFFTFQYSIGFIASSLILQATSNFAFFIVLPDFIILQVAITKVTFIKRF